MRFSNRANKLKPSATLSLSAKAIALKSKGKDVISFATGEPDFRTPKAVCDAAKAGIDAGLTRYDSPKGMLELRKAISEKLKADNGLEYAADEIVVTPGAKLAIYDALQLLIDDGDEVVFQSPYWVSYPDQVELAGGVSKIIQTGPQEDFKLSADQLRAAITDRTKVFILNSPSNPTGSVYDRREIEAIAKVCVEKDLVVISDEIYEKLIYEGEHVSIASMRGMRERTIVVNGFSKSYAMTGWRIGYAAAPAEFARKLAAIVSQQSTCVPPFIQEASIGALTNSAEDVEKMRGEFKRRRDLFISELRNKMDIPINNPAGAFYIWVDVRNYLNSKCKTSAELAEFLLNEKLLVVVPGEAFGSPGFLRLSYAASQRDIKDGAARLIEGLKQV